jgi:hypothetical protein
VKQITRRARSTSTIRIAIRSRLRRYDRATNLPVFAAHSHRSSRRRSRALQPFPLELNRNPGSGVAEMAVDSCVAHVLYRRLPSPAEASVRTVGQRQGFAQAGTGAHPRSSRGRLSPEHAPARACRCENFSIRRCWTGPRGTGLARSISVGSAQPAAASPQRSAIVPAGHDARFFHSVILVSPWCAT